MEKVNWSNKEEILKFISDYNDELFTGIYHIGDVIDKIDPSLWKDKDLVKAIVKYSDNILTEQAKEFLNLDNPYRDEMIIAALGGRGSTGILGYIHDGERFKEMPEAAIALLKRRPEYFYRYKGEVFNAELLNNENVVLGGLDTSRENLLENPRIIQVILEKWEKNPHVMEKLASVITRNANEG